MEEEKDLVGRLMIEFAEFKNSPPIQVQIHPLALFSIVTQVQLALRHPENNGWNAEQGEASARQLQGAFDPDSAAFQLLEMGWNPALDRRVP